MGASGRKGEIGEKRLDFRVGNAIRSFGLDLGLKRTEEGQWRRAMDPPDVLEGT